MSMYRKRQFKMTLMRKRSMAGYLFVLPFIVGFIFFFLSPVITSIKFTFNEIMSTSDGFSMDPIGWKNYNELLFVDPYYREGLTAALGNIMLNVVCVPIFSFMMAAILNQQFRGRTVFRVIFFLPVVLTSGVMITMNIDALTAIMSEKLEYTGDVNMLNSVTAVVQQMNLSAAFTGFVVNAATRIYDIVNASGVQILVFLAGLQTVSPSLFESSNIEGATAWENFWKITFPMVSPMILVNLVYTVVDAMNSASTRTVTGTLNVHMLYSEAATRGWMFFICVMVILAVMSFLVSRFVYYENE